MTDRPILFSSAMVSALLAGRKTQTRRVLGGLGDQPIVEYDGMYMWKQGYRWGAVSDPKFPPGVRFAVGDRLWVREAHHRTNDSKTSHLVGYDFADGHVTREDRHIIAGIGDVQFFRHSLGGWGGRDSRNYPAMHMPRWASRLTLIVTEVRVQRLQEISEEDAIAEGLESQQGGGLGPGPGFKWVGIGYHAGTMSSWGKCYHTPHGAGMSGCSCNVAGPSPAQCAYRELWDHLNAARGFGWNANPWVVAVSFTVERRNIDA